jgi:hypothetical protein
MITGRRAVSFHGGRGTGTHRKAQKPAGVSRDFVMPRTNLLPDAVYYVDDAANTLNLLHA